MREDFLANNTGSITRRKGIERACDPRFSPIHCLPRARPRNNPTRSGSLRDSGEIGLASRVDQNAQAIEENGNKIALSPDFENLAEAWREGLQTSVLLDYLRVLQQLDTPDQNDRILGRVIAANITYLLGDLEKGHRLARQVMDLSLEYDKPDLPCYRWLASYPFWNSRLFMGEFDRAANGLGDLWHTEYWRYNQTIREKLHSFFQANPATLDPIASVPRHLILASALKGWPIITKSTQIDVSDRDSESEGADGWAESWYQCGKQLCKNESISLQFTQAYMALYCITVKDLYEPPNLLREIRDTDAIVSLYVKHGMLGLYHFYCKQYEKALTELRVADAVSGISGNRFLECIFLPAQAAAAAWTKKSLDPEIRALMTRVKRRAAISPNNFFDSLICAAEMIIAAANEETGRCDFLLGRVRRLAGDDLKHGIIKIFHLAEL